MKTIPNSLHFENRDKKEIMKCITCDRDNLTEDDFHTDNHNKNNKSNRCKMCALKYMKTYYQANKAHLQEYRQKRFGENKRLIERCKELIRIFSVFFPEQYQEAMKIIKERKI